MNVLFCTQSASLRLFYDLAKTVGHRLPIDRIGFTVADSWAYEEWLTERPEFQREGHVILKEWDVTARRHDRVDLGKIAAWERSLGRAGEPGLFGAVVADRRLFMGPDSTYTQDYRRRFTDDELLSILQAGIEELERVFDELRPDLVVGFICVTMLEYLAYLIARARRISVLNLRPTRIGDRVSFSSLLNDPDPAFVAAYKRIRAGQGGDLAAARGHLQRVRVEHGRYEGVVQPSDKPALAVNTSQSPLRAALKTAAHYRRYMNTAARTDNHVPHPLRVLAYTAIFNPLRARITSRYLASRFISDQELAAGNYAFYPLHTEPEVSLLVYGRPFVNQIEIVRALAISLPAHMFLVIKEHPWMVGKRTRGAYSKLLNIPRVRIARPEIDARTLVAKSSLVAVITGSVALEAAILGKPVLTFGDCPYNALPDTMVRRCADLRRLPADIDALLDSYHCDKAALEAYVAAVFERSASVNLYSILLGKRRVHAERASDYSVEIERLAEHLLQVLAPAPSAIFENGPARW